MIELTLLRGRAEGVSDLWRLVLERKFLGRLRGGKASGGAVFESGAELAQRGVRFS